MAAALYLFCICETNPSKWHFPLVIYPIFCNESFLAVNNIGEKVLYSHVKKNFFI